MLQIAALLILSQQPLEPVMQGVASYYTVASSSAVTASGERFSDAEYTCAMLTGEFGDHFMVVADNGNSVVVKLNDRKPERSKLIAVGFYDLGPGEVDLTKAATLDVGGESVAVPGLAPSANGSKYVHEEAGVSFLIKPDRRGSSRAKFKLRVTKDLAGKVDPDAVLVMRFAGADTAGTGSVTLTGGKYALRRVRGTLVEPGQ